MHFNVSRLMMEPSGSTRTYAVDDDFTAMDSGGVQRVRGSVRLLRTDRGVWVSAELDSESVCDCSRCLKGYRQPLRMTIEEESFPEQDLDGVDGAAGHRGNPAIGEKFTIDENHILDLTEVVREYAALNMPMKPVCRDDCKGMCLQCGTDLNESACQCDDASLDLRWGPLLEVGHTGRMDG